MADRYAPTHVVPGDGLPAWSAPEGSAPPVTTLDPGLDVAVTERRGDWAHILCSNGWTGWVDGRRLVESPHTATRPPLPPAPQPQVGARGSDPTRTVVGPAATPPPGSPVAAPAAGTPPPPGAVGTAPPGAPTGPGWGAPTRSGARIGAGQVVAAIGSFIILVSAWFNWFRLEADPLRQVHSSAYKIEAHFLLDSLSTGAGGLSLGVVVFLVGTIGIAFALMPGARSLRIANIAIGAATLAIALLYIWQLKNFADRGAEFQLSDFLDAGPFIALFGALITGVGGIVSLAIKR